MRKKFLSVLMLGLLAVGTTSTITSCKDYDDDISSLKTNVADLTTQLNSLKSNYEQLSKDVDTKIEAAKTALQAAIDRKADASVVKDLADNLANNYYTSAVIDSKLTAINDALTALKNDTYTKSEVDAKLAALKGDISDEIKNAVNAEDVQLKAYVNGVKEDLQIQITALQNIKADERLTALENKLSDYPTVKQQVSTNKQKIAELESAVRLLQSDISLCATKEALSEAVQGLQTKIDAVSTSVDGLTILVSKRLTSIVFSPTYFVNGIEAISFASLKYYDWGHVETTSRQGYPENDNWYADYAPEDLKQKPDVSKLTYIDDESAVAEYRINPILANSMLKECVDTFDVLTHQAVNEVTSRADAENALVKVSKTEYNNGVLKVYLKKNSTSYIGTKNELTENPQYKETFNLLAVRAKLAKKAMTSEEIKNNAIIYVYSDWARIIQEAGRPYIHQSTWNKLHFLRFSEIYGDDMKSASGSKRPIAASYDKSKKVTGMYDKDKVKTFFDKHLNNNDGTCLEVKYTETVDLNKLVAVCIGVHDGATSDKEIVDYKKRGLKFQYALTQYDVWDVNTSSYTDESSYAKIENGILSATGITGEVGAQVSTGSVNVSAVNRTPVVQIVLKDTVNNQVVDVQYLMVRWTNPAENQAVPSLGEDKISVAYNCSTPVLSGIIDLEQYFTIEKLTNEQFRALYGYAYDGKLYSSNVVKAGVPVGEVIGTASYERGASHGLTSDQVKWQITPSSTFNYEDSLVKYNGSYTFKGYILLTSAVGACPTKSIYVEATLTHDLSKYPKAAYSANANYIEAHWSKNGGALTTENVNKYITCSVLPIESKSILNYATTTIGHDIATGFINNGKAYSTNSYINMFGDMVDKDKVNGHYEVQLIFDSSRLSMLPEGYKWSLSADSKTLYYDVNKVAATITVDGTEVKLYESNWGMSTSVLSIGARALLGEKVPVKFVGNYRYICEKKKSCDIDKFLVYFEKPLSYSSIPGEINLNDQTHNGDAQTLNTNKLFKVDEAWGNNKNVVWGESINTTLKPWYGINVVEFDNAPAYNNNNNIITGTWFVLNDAKTNLNKKGGVDTACNTLLTELTNDDNTQKYLFLWNGEQGPNAKFIFFEQKDNGGTSQTLSNDLGEKGMKIEVNAYLPGKYFLVPADPKSDKNRLVSKITVTISPKQTAKRY